MQYARRVQQELSDVYFFFLSDLWLDKPQTFVGLQKMFDNCIENSFIPKVIILCGNFTSRSIIQGSARDIQRYQGMRVCLPTFCKFSDNTTDERKF